MNKYQHSGLSREGIHLPVKTTDHRTEVVVLEVDMYSMVVFEWERGVV